jgi:hypothetical protein
LIDVSVPSERNVKQQKAEKKLKCNKWGSGIELRARVPYPMLYIMNITTFMGLYNLEYISTVVLITLIFKTLLIKQQEDK